MIQCKGTRRFPNRNREYLMQWLYDSLPLLRDPFYSVPTKVYWVFHNLIDFPKCVYCNSNINNVMRNIKMPNGYAQCCCMSCSIKFAIEHGNVIEKRQQTLDDKYGKDRLAIRIKMSQTKQAFSVEKKKQIQEKRIQSTRLHYGYDHVFQVPSIIEDIKQTHLKNLGVENPAQSPIIQEKHAQHMDEIVAKCNATKRKNKSFNISKQEEKCYHMLHFIYPHLMRQYRSIEYPFACDFYDPDSNTYFEFNGSWTHCGHWFDPTNKDDIRELERMKSKHSQYYDNAIETWTIRDVNKRNTAMKNNLKYVVFWNLDEARKHVLNFKIDNTI